MSGEVILCHLGFHFYWGQSSSIKKEAQAVTRTLEGENFLLKENCKHLRHGENRGLQFLAGDARPGTTSSEKDSEPPVVH